MLIAGSLSATCVAAGPPTITIPASEESVYRYIEIVAEQAGVPVEIDEKSFERLGWQEYLDEFREPMTFSAKGHVDEVLEQLFANWQSEDEIIITPKHRETADGEQIRIVAIPQTLQVLADNARWLTVEEARKLVSEKNKFGDLAWDGSLHACVEMSPEVAAVLATFMGDLWLGELEELSVATAQALAKHRVARWRWETTYEREADDWGFTEWYERLATEPWVDDDGRPYVPPLTKPRPFISADYVALEFRGKPFHGTPVDKRALHGGVAEEEWAALSEDERNDYLASAVSWHEVTCRYPPPPPTNAFLDGMEFWRWPEEITESLTYHPDVFTGTLCLPRLRSLSPDVAGALAKYQGAFLWLDGVESLMSDAVVALASGRAHITLSEKAEVDIGFVDQTCSYDRVYEGLLTDVTRNVEEAVDVATIHSVGWHSTLSVGMGMGGAF